MSFPENFIWGAASASYQVEGAAFADGKGLSVWDVFSHSPGKVQNGDTGDVACDHYHRYADDVALMQGLGLRAYRFSVSWPRIYPDGTGAINAAGLDFYDRLVDSLLAADIAPYVTLFHWDYPHALYCRGGWLNRDSANWFADYTATVVERLSDRVSVWMPLNEPAVFANLGHLSGIHAPGDKHGLRNMLLIIHNILRANGASAQAIRAAAKTTPQVGIAKAFGVAYPASDDPADVEVAYRANFTITEPNLWSQSWWLDPIFIGDYPADGRAVFGSDLPEITPDDLLLIAQPLDFLGVNHYQGSAVRAGQDGRPQAVPYPIGGPRSLVHWPVTPEGLYWGSRFFWERYNTPIMITENGFSSHDWVALDGQVHDPQRIDYTRRYLLNLKRAVSDGVDVRAYLYWSIMDNFEWAAGYLQRFGMIYVDYATQQRVLKDSALWYRDVIASNGANLDV